jgi:putative ABC transport system permease protein
MRADFLHDVRYAWRTMRHAPAFSVAAILALALGIGANTAIFSVVRAVLLRPLPYGDADRLAFVWNSAPEQPRFALTPGRFIDLRQRGSSFESVAAISQIAYTLTGDGDAERLSAQSVSANFFEILGTSAILGRVFTPADKGARVVVLSHALWTQRFGGDRSIVGRTLVLNDIPYTVVGVTPPTFIWPIITPVASNAPHPLIWVAAVDHDVPALHVETTDLPSNRQFGYLRAVGKLKAGVTIDQARSELDRIAGQLGQEYPATDGGRGLTIVSLRAQLVGDVQRPLLVLTAAVVFVLAIACANVASLLLGRAAARRRELAVRAAIGAGRGRLIRQLVTESVVMAFCAAAVGLVIAWWVTPALVSLSPARVLRLEEARIDGGVFAFTLLLSLLTGVAFGVLPALHASALRASEALKEGAVRTAGRNGVRVRDALAIAQVAIALVLLTGAGLLLRSFITLQRTSTGIDTTNLLAFDVALSGQRAEYQRLQVAFYEDMLARLRALPGVVSAGAAVTLPIGGDDFGSSVFIEGQPDPPAGREAHAGFQLVSARYFETMRIGLEEGRDFSAADTRQAPPVTIVNRQLARTHWPGTSPIGRRIRQSRTGPWMTIVGVVSDVRHFGPAVPPRPEFYQPYTQNSMSFMAVVVRTSVDPLRVVPAARAAIREMDPAQPISGVSTMEAHLRRSVSEPRFMSTLVAAFAALAGLLAALGIYATLAFAVAQRTREIGIRMALGAQRGRVVGLVLRRGVIIACTGTTIGLIAAVALTRVLARMLYGVSPTDLPTYAAVTVSFGLLALIACALPALAATRVDPIRTLRAE